MQSVCRMRRKRTPQPKTPVLTKCAAWSSLLCIPFLGQQGGYNVLICAVQSGDASTLAWALAMVRTKLTAEDRQAALLQANKNDGKNFMLWAAAKGSLGDAAVQSEMEKIDDATMTKVLTKITKASGLLLCPH